VDASRRNFRHSSRHGLSAPKAYMNTTVSTYTPHTPHRESSSRASTAGSEGIGASRAKACSRSFEIDRAGSAASKVPMASLTTTATLVRRSTARRSRRRRVLVSNRSSNLPSSLRTTGLSVRTPLVVHCIIRARSGGERGGLTPAAPRVGRLQRRPPRDETWHTRPKPCYRGDTDPVLNPRPSR